MYKKFFKRYWPIILFLFIFSVVIRLLTEAQTPEKKLPVYSPSMVSEELVEEEIRYVKKYHRINPFQWLTKMVKQSLKWITLIKYMLLIFLYNLSKYLPNDDRKYVVHTGKIKRR